METLPSPSRFGAALDWLTARLSEPSTWEGVVKLLTASGVVIQPDLAAQVVAVGLAVNGLINVVRKERNPNL